MGFYNLLDNLQLGLIANQVGVLFQESLHLYSIVQQVEYNYKLDGR
jgi:hypothetical protein